MAARDCWCARTNSQASEQAALAAREAAHTHTERGMGYRERVWRRRWWRWGKAGGGRAVLSRWMLRSLPCPMRAPFRVSADDAGHSMEGGRAWPKRAVDVVPCALWPRRVHVSNPLFIPAPHSTGAPSTFGRAPRSSRLGRALGSLVSSLFSLPPIIAFLSCEAFFNLDLSQNKNKTQRKGGCDNKKKESIVRAVGGQKKGTRAASLPNGGGGGGKRAWGKEIGILRQSSAKRMRRGQADAALRRLARAPRPRSCTATITPKTWPSGGGAPAAARAICSISARPRISLL